MMLYWEGSGSWLVNSTRCKFIYIYIIGITNYDTNSNLDPMIGCIINRRHNAHTHAHTYTHMYRYTYSYLYAYTYTNTHTPTHTHTPTNTHTSNYQHELLSAREGRRFLAPAKREGRRVTRMVAALLSANRDVRPICCRLLANFTLIRVKSNMYI